MPSANRNALSGSLNDRETDGLIDKRLEAYDGCNFDEFFFPTTQSCEECAKYCANGIDSDTCPRRCAEYYNKLANDYQKAEIEQMSSEYDYKLEEMSAEWLVLKVITGAVAVAIFIFGVYYFGRCLKRRFQRKTTAGESSTSTQDPGNAQNNAPAALSDEAPNSNNGSPSPPARRPQPSGNLGQTNAAHSNSAEAVNSRSEGEVPANEHGERAFAGQNAVRNNQPSAERTENGAVAPQQIVVQIG